MVLPPNPKQAYGDKKPPVHLVPPALTFAAARALGEGAVKYGPYNWREKSVEVMTYVGAMLRHLYAWMDGEEIDPESVTGKHHLDGVAACVAILLDAISIGCAIDNRPPKGAGPLLARGIVGNFPPADSSDGVPEAIDDVADPPTSPERGLRACGDCGIPIAAVAEHCSDCAVDAICAEGSQL